MPPQNQVPPEFENLLELPPAERKRKVGDFIYPKIAAVYKE
jgi:hypothetical protein